MHAAPAHIALGHTLKKSPPLIAPRWVSQFSGLGEPQLVAGASGLKIGMQHNTNFCRVVVKIEHAADLDSMALREQTALAYESVFKTLNEFSPVRFWNFLPDIHRVMDDGQSRYMVFNAGRFQAFEKQYGPYDQFDSSVATASAVGHQSGDLYIHCLAARVPGIHRGNPRQISPHKYSERFGKRPPCFARATFLTDHKLLLIGGTASIRGEDSLHDHIAAQTSETLVNLSHLIASTCAQFDLPTLADPLGCMIDLRVYHPRSSDGEWLQKSLEDRLPNLQQLVTVHSDLCRAELLVEIEGVARLSPMVF